MKQMMLILEVEDYFEPGQCSDCPIAVLDTYDYDYYCSMHCHYMDCPLINKEDYDCEELDK